MKRKRPDSPDPELRTQAEDRLRDASPSGEGQPLSAAEAMKLVHELQVHEVELEMQNDELRRSREMLEAAHKRYSDLFDRAPVGYFSLDPNGRVRQVNRTGCLLLGKEPAELIGKPFESLVTPADRAAFGALLQSALTSHRVESCEASLELSGSSSGAQEGSAPGALWTILEASVTADEDEFRLAVIDVTEARRARAEREQMREALIEHHRLESIGRLAGGVAHDFNNMLSVILGHVELILDQHDNNHSLQEPLAEIHNAAKRSANLTRQLLAIARKQVITPTRLQLNDAVAGRLDMLRRLIGENTELVWWPGEDLWAVEIDPAQLDQILVNLAANARDAISDMGRLTLETENVTVTSEFAKAHPLASPGEFVRLAVSDTGTGIDPETLKHIFEPFFTTKAVGEGTGLGLATVYGIIQQNDGFLDVASSVDQGTRIQIFLPHAPGTEAPLRTDSPNPAAGSGETILVVEDEGALLRLVRTTLESYGYQVLAAGSPRQALALVGSLAPEAALDLLVTDVLMPEMNGRDLHDRIIELRPGLRTLFISGYPAEVIAQEGVIEEGVDFLQKPFSVHSLAGRVRELLDR